MRRVFFAAPAVFGEIQLIGSVELIAHGNVIGRFADRTYHSQKQPLFFFCHTLCHYSRLFPGKKGGVNFPAVYFEKLPRQSFVP